MAYHIFYCNDDGEHRHDVMPDKALLNEYLNQASNNGERTLGFVRNFDDLEYTDEFDERFFIIHGIHVLPTPVEVQTKWQV